MRYRLQTLEPAIDESAQSYACRQARRLQLPLSLWCTDLGIKQVDLQRGAASAVEQVADHGGADPNRLMLSTLVRQSDRDVLLNGQMLTRPSLRRIRLRVCVQCMRDQLRDGSIWDVSIQTNWFLNAIYTCPRHNVALVTVGERKHAARHEWSLMTEAFLGSPEARVTPTERCPGEFETYVANRVRTGAPTIGGEINEIPLHAATFLVPIIGQTLLNGAQTDQEIIKAGDAGFRALREPRGLENALSEIERNAGRRQLHQGPQHRLGRHFFEWIARGARHPDFQPIRERTRAFILDNIPVDRGSMLLGRPVEGAKLHNVSTLSAATGLNPKALRSRLEQGGLLMAEADAGDLPMPAEEVETWLARVVDVVGRREAEEFLGCGTSHYLTLRRAKLIKPISVARGILNHRYERSALEEFRAKLLDAAKRTDERPEGYAGFEQIRTRINCSVSVVLKAILACEFKGIASRPGNVRIDALEFDVEEAKDLVRGAPLPGLVVTELASYWNVTYSTVHALIEEGHLATQQARHPIKRAMMTVVPYDAMGRFEDSYVHEKELRERTGLGAQELRAWLRSRSINGAFKQSLKRSPFYRRSDVPI